MYTLYRYLKVRVLQEDKAASAKALVANAWNVQGIVKEPVWLERSKLERADEVMCDMRGLTSCRTS